MRKMTMAIGIAAALASAACSKSGEGTSPAPSTTSTPAAAPSTVPSASASAAPSAAAPAPQKTELLIASVGETMTFDKTALTVPAGASVHLTLKNNAKSPLMPHNWVLVKTGTEAAVALEGLQKAPDAGHVFPGVNVLAYTPEAKPGETVEVTFTAPAAGKYPYICTTPGHYVMMKGVLTVTP